MIKKVTIILLLVTSLWVGGCSIASTNEQIAGQEALVKEATVSGTVTDIQGQALIAQLVIIGDDDSIRINTDMLGRFSIVLPLGEYEFEITKGSEYERETVQVQVEDRKAKYLGTYALEKLYETNCIAGDLHQHSSYSFDATDSPAEILLSDLSVGLGFGVITDHNDVRANAEFLNATLEGFVPIAGIEITTDRGHYNAINYSSVVDTDVSDGAADIARIVETVNEEPAALLQINHPVRAEFDFEDWALIEDFDTIEVWNGKRITPYVEGEPNYMALQKWYELLNQGLFIPATAGSDNHDVSGNAMFAADTYASDDERFFMTSMYSGSPRNYVYAEADAQSILNAIRAGNSFLTNNPLAYLDIEGVIPGETIAAGTLDIHVRIESNRSLTHYALVKNGQTLYEEDVTGMVVENTVRVGLQEGDWVVLVVRGENGDYAITNPVFID